MCWLLGLSITAGEGLGGRSLQLWCNVGRTASALAGRCLPLHHPPNAWVRCLESHASCESFFNLPQALIVIHRARSEAESKPGSPQLASRQHSIKQQQCTSHKRKQPLRSACKPPQIQTSLRQPACQGDDKVLLEVLAAKQQNLRHSRHS